MAAVPEKRVDSLDIYLCINCKLGRSWQGYGTIEEDNNVDLEKSQFSIDGESSNYTGVQISDVRKIRQALLRKNKGKVFWVPTTVNKNATPGTWKIKIETDKTDADDPFIEIVEGPFIVRDKLFAG